MLCVDPGTPSVITGTLVGTHSVGTSTNPVINLTDLQDSSIKYDKDFWVTIGSISLHQSHRRVILTGEWLWGTHLTAVQILLKHTLKMTQKGITLSSGSVQILHVNGNHWITVSTLMLTENDDDVIVYDSLNSHVRHGTKMQLANLIKTSKKS